MAAVQSPKGVREETRANIVYSLLQWQFAEYAYWDSFVFIEDDIKIRFILS